MKVIVSHDVDHLTVTEHCRGIFVPKFIIRTMGERVLGGIGRTECSRRWSDLRTNKWQNIEELMQFDRAQEVPATYFVAVRQGLGLTYSAQQAAPWIRRIREAGFDIGVHGLCHTDEDGLRAERDEFSAFAGQPPAGIRMHYLRHTHDTLRWMAGAGYAYDSTVLALDAPFLVEGMVEFPLHIMDALMFYPGSTYTVPSLRKAMDLTRRTIDAVNSKNLPYLTILFHDWYFTPGFSAFREWYLWIIDFLKRGGGEFTTYAQAVKEWKP